MTCAVDILTLLFSVIYHPNIHFYLDEEISKRNWQTATMFTEHAYERIHFEI